LRSFIPLFCQFLSEFKVTEVAEKCECHFESWV
jgi:hypothetical protein